MVCIINPKTLNHVTYIILIKLTIIYHFIDLIFFDTKVYKLHSLNGVFKRIIYNHLKYKASFLDARTNEVVCHI